MERSTYSRGSGTGSGVGGCRPDLRFRYEYCFCKKLASLRIVKSHGKPSRGKLYFVCERDECKFFNWCSPIEPIEEEDGLDSPPTLVETDGDKVSLILASVEDNNRAIQKLSRVVKYGFSLCVIAILVCMMKCN